MEDTDYLRLMREAVSAGHIRATLDYAKLEHVDSPISVQADSNRWIYGLIVVVSAAAWFGGMWWGIGAATLGAAGWFGIGKRWHRQRMERRFYDLSLQHSEEWKKLWRMPGVTLIDTRTGAECVSPAGNWRGFVGTASQAAAPPTAGEASPI